MYPILKAISTIAMTYGVTLVIIALLLLPFQIWYKKKHGPESRRGIKIMTVTIFIVAALIALPISISKIRTSDRKSSAYRMAVKASQQMEMNKRMRDKQSSQLKPVGLRETKKPADSLEKTREREAGSDRQQNESRQQEVRERQDAMRRYMEETREMREADFYRPVSGPATADQKLVDAKIIAANKELQELKSRQQAYEKARVDAQEERSRLMKERPVDSDRLREVSTIFHESSREKILLSGSINKKRSEIMQLLSERRDLGR